MKISKILLFFLFSTIASAQNLTISSSGQTGTSGTNWSISGSTLTATGTANIRASVIVNALANGNLSVVGNSTNFAVTLSEAINASTSGSALTIGSVTNAGAITVSADISLAGPITVYGSNITVSQNLTSTLAAADILLQATGAINLASSKIIQTAGGDVTFNANSGGTATTLDSAIYLNSSSQILSNGGNITLGGGYSGTEGNLYAATNNVGGGYAVRLDASTVVNADGGNIKIYGRNVLSYGDGIYLSAVNISTLGSGTIGIYGDSYGGYNGTYYFGGISFENNASTIQTVNGSITLKGILTQSQSTQGYGINFYRSGGSTGQTKHIQILSQTGDIQITGDRGSTSGAGIGHSSWGNIYFGSPSNNSFTATGAIKFTYSNLINAGYNGFKVKTTGPVTYEPVATSFIAAQTFPPNAYATLADGASSLTIGKSSNTADITLDAAQTIAGPISTYGGIVTLNANLTSTLESSKILIRATNQINTANNVSFLTNKGDFILWSDSDATSGGRIWLGDNNTINTINGSAVSGLSNGGRIVLAGGLDNGANGGTTNDGIPDGFASNPSSIGVYLGDTTSNYTQMYSGGGDIIVRGASSYASATNSGTGLWSNGRWLANAGKGTIFMNGTSTNFYAINFSNPASNVSTGNKHIEFISDKASGTAISIMGTSSASYGVVFNYENPKEVRATGGGAIVVNGTGGGSVPGIFIQNTDILATSGDITFNGGTNGIRVASSGTRLGSKASSAITSSSSTIKWIANSLDLYGLTSGFTNSFNTTGTATIEPFGTSFSSTLTFPNTITLASTVSGLTLGKSGNLGNITIGSALSLTAPITIYGGTVALNGPITATNNNLTIEANTALTQNASGAITANGLALSGAGTCTLNNTSNAIETIAGGSATNRLGSMSFTDASGGLTIGTIGSLSGIYTNTGVVSIETLTGNINFNESVSTNNTTAAALIINAGKNAIIGVSSGGDIHVSGTPVITTGSGGIAKLFSGLESNSPGLTDLVGVNNARYNYDETTTTFAPVLAVNTNYAIYRTSLGTGDLTIVSSGGDAINTTWIYENGVISTTTSPVNINASVLQDYLSTGALTIEAGNVTVNSAITGTSNTAFVINSNGTKTITVNAAVSLGGAITFNSNDFMLENGVNISTSTASDITINANGNFGTTSTTRRTISSANGTIIIHADKDANGTGILDLDYLTLNPGTGATIIRGETVAFSVGSIAGPYINGTGSFTFESSDPSFGQIIYTSWFQIDQDNNGISALTLGKIGNTADIEQNTNFTIAGPIKYYGGYVNINGTLTSSANGDILLKGIANTTYSVAIQSGKSIIKSSGSGTLTMQGHGWLINNGTITTSGTGILNVVLWSDFDNSNNDGGISQNGTISTNGGDVWLGGSNSNGGSFTWNGLAVGDGPSIGTAGYNSKALYLYGNITTNGGDFLAWAGTGVTAGIYTDTSTEVNVGSGNLVLITPTVLGTGPSLFFRQSGGTFTLVPNGGSFPSTLDWSPYLYVYGGMTGWNFPDDFNYLWIENPSTLTNLTVGRYDGMTNGGTPVVMTNSSAITIAVPSGYPSQTTTNTIAGSMNFYGGAITLNTNIITTNTTTGNIALNGTSIAGTGNIALAAGRTATLNVSATSTYDGVISGTGSALTKSGSGKLMLTKDQTYSGVTTITAGDLQVGSGGSVSQASSGTISSTTAVAVASGSKLILTPNENIVFTAPISGEGGVEIKGASGAYYTSFLTGTAATIATNSTVLEVLTRITGGFQQSANINGGGQTAGAYIKSYNATTNTATFQFQQFDGTFTKCVFVELLQSGNNVQIRGNTSIYNGAGYRTGNYIGADLSTGSTQIGPGLATTSTGTGYGISKVYMSGKVNFTGNLTYTGNTSLSNTVTNGVNGNLYSYISKGTQEITNASTGFPSTSTVINNGLVIFNRTTPLTVTSNIEGTEDLLQVGAEIALAGTCTHSGLTTIDLNKSLIIGNGATSGSITGNIINYGTLTFNRSTDSNHSGVISGSGSLIKLGAGTHTLTGLNTYAGATTITAGKLVLERDVPVTSSTGFSGDGELVIQPASASFTTNLSYPLSGFNVSSTIGGLTIGKLGNSANLTVTNATAAQGPITFYSGTLTLNAAVTASNNGAISFYSDNAIGGLSSPRAVTAGGLFKYIPQSNSFNAAVTYPISNLNVSSAGLTIGKATNTSDISFENNTTIAGPITAYGGTITLNADLTTTNNGSISLYTDNPLGGLGTARTLTAAGAFKYIPRVTTFSADVTYPIANLTATSAGLTIGKTTNDKNITINQDITGPFDIELYGNNVNINSNLTTTGINAIMYLKGNTIIAAGKSITSGGNFTHDGNMTFKSTATGTAAFGTLGGTFTTVNGASSVERYIPAKRAYRFISPSVTTTTSIRDNWQENGGADGGFGTHITGLNGSANGFDSTTTNNSSLFSFDHANGVWAAVTNTTSNTLSAGTAYRLMVRGDRLTNLTTNTPTTSVTTLRATGVLKTGDYSPTLNQASEGYSFVGNPYQAPVDIKAVLAASTNMNSGVVYYWDPTLNARGAYVTRTLGTVNQNSPSSNFDQYLQPGQAVFVKKATTDSAASILFTESNKSVTNSAAGVFRTTTTEKFGTIRTNLRASIDNQWTTIEGALAVFNPMYSWDVVQEDANKLSNLDEEVSFMQNNTSLAIACQSNPSPTNELPIRLNTTRRTNYQWQFELGNYSGPTPYLFDTQNNTYVTIENNTIVPFTVNGQENNRFKIVFQNETLSTSEFSNSFALYPNPSVAGNTSFNLKGTTTATVSLYTILGQIIPINTSVNGNTMQVTPKLILNKGVYLVTIIDEGKKAQIKWIVE